MGENVARPWLSCLGDQDPPPGAGRTANSEELPSVVPEEAAAALGSPGSTAEPAGWLAAFGQAWAVPDPHNLPRAPGEVAARAGGAEVQLLLERWVRRVALGGDHRRGVARLDIGEGPLSGAQLVIIAEPGSVSVELTLPASGSPSGLDERLRERLTRRGYAAEVTVR